MAKKTMGNTLKTYMKRHGIKQQFVSDETGIRPQILGAMLNEKRKIEVTEYYEICKAMRANPDAIAAEAGIWEQDKAAQLI